MKNCNLVKLDSWIKLKSWTRDVMTWRRKSDRWSYKMNEFSRSGRKKLKNRYWPSKTSAMKKQNIRNEASDNQQKPPKAMSQMAKHPTGPSVRARTLNTQPTLNLTDSKSLECSRWSKSVTLHLQSLTNQLWTTECNLVNQDMSKPTILAFSSMKQIKKTKLSTQTSTRKFTSDSLTTRQNLIDCRSRMKTSWVSIATD